MDNLIVIDIAALWSEDKKYIIKEIVIVNRYEIYASKIKSPKYLRPDYKTNYWLKKFKHRLEWNDDGIHLYEVKRKLNELIRDGACVKSKGLDKCRRLQEIFNIPIYNIEEDGCPKINADKTIEKAYKIFQWVMQQERKNLQVKKLQRWKKGEEL